MNDILKAIMCVILTALCLSMIGWAYRGDMSILKWVVSVLGSLPIVYFWMDKFPLIK